MSMLPNSNQRVRRAALVTALTGSLLFSILPISARAAISPEAFEHCLLENANEERADSGVAPLVMAHDKVQPVRDWSEWMRFNDFEHMPSSLRQQILPPDWTTWGENIAHHSWQGMPDCDVIHEMWMNSPGHRASILSPNFRYAAFGTYVDESGWWATQLFFDATFYDPECDGEFCDDDGSIFEADIEWMAANGITRGCNPPANTMYCPDDPVTRDVMAVYLARALELPAATRDYFTDDDGSPFEADINRLAESGITRGCGPQVFCPKGVVDRGQMAAFLSRGLGLTDVGGGDYFDDDNQSIFEADINRLAAAGVTRGCGERVYCPDRPVDRGAMAAFLHRAIGAKP